MPTALHVSLTNLLVVLLPVSALAQDVSGTWRFSVVLDVGTGEPTFVFEQGGDRLTGKYEGTFDAAELTRTVVGDTIEFSFGTQGVTATYTGTIAGETMAGTCVYGQPAEGTWEGERD